MNEAVHLAISTCPNDTFAFHAILAGKIDTRGIEFEIELSDVQELNNGLFAGKYDVAKASFNAALQLSHEVSVFDSGSALGFGVGPLLLASTKEIADRVRESTMLNVDQREPLAFRARCPGEHTTATLLWQLFFAHAGTVNQVVFSDIMPALQSGEADLGVCIHEGRFTWEEQGLHLVADLGELWESSTSAPLPLGGILGRRSVGDETLATIQSVIRDSINYGFANREETLESMRQYAQEFEDKVLMAHVDLYVNDWTRELGVVGQEALDILHRRAIEMGVISAQQPKLERILGV